MTDKRAMLFSSKKRQCSLFVFLLFLLRICLQSSATTAFTMKTPNEPAPPTPEPQGNLLALNIPIEELLGSVTTYNNVEGSDNKSQQLRTSARVFKKMKLDSANAAPLTPEKKETPAKEEQPRPPEIKKRPIWYPEDKSLFFEALNEFGKDFDSIQNYISNKQKKRGLPESAIKNKDQIRHVYYRTWHKISKHLKFSSDIKKIAQELYALINYGEMRRKIGSVSEKNCIKLNELIYTGSVALRRRGKTIRIRTPMCRALRKLNQLDETHEEIKLPTRVLVELRPKDMDCFMRVQACAQNPLLRTIMPLQKRLSSLIECATQKWKTQFAANYEKTLASVNNFTINCLPDPETSEQCKQLLNPPLRLAPPPEAKIDIPSFNLTEYLTCQNICLNSYEERVGVKVPGEQLWQWVWGKNTSKRGTKRARHESSSEKKTPEVTSENANEGGAIDCDVESSFNNTVDEVVNTLLALTKQDNSEEEPEEPNKTHPEDAAKKKEVEDAIKKEHDVNRIRQGWTIEDCGTISIGELYLMFGADGKLILEYNWDEPTPPKLEDTIIKTENETNEVDNEIPPNDLNLSLQRLLSVAKLHYRKNMIKCPCGHVCGGPQKQKGGASKKNTDSKMCDKGTQTLEQITKERSNTQSRATNPSSFVPIGPNPHIRQYSPASLLQRQNFRAQLQRLQPRFCSRRGRPRAKPVVVERKLPLLANKEDSEHRIVQMNIISQEVIKPLCVCSDEGICTESSSVEQSTDPVFSTVVEASTSSGLTAPLDVTDNAVMSSSRVCSPTSISNLIEMALGPQNEQQSDGNKDGAETPSFAGLLSDGIQNSAPPSPSRLLKENDNQWLNSEVADFSLSSFLGHLESPVKATQSAASIAGDVSQDVDVQLQSLLNESSLDYAAKFADLAAEVVSDNKKL